MSTSRNILYGITTALELFPSPSRRKVKIRSDAERLQGDWEKIGKDLWRVLEHGKEQVTPNQAP